MPVNDGIRRVVTSICMKRWSKLSQVQYRSAAQLLHSEKRALEHITSRLSISDLFSPNKNRPIGLAIIYI